MLDFTIYIVDDEEAIVDSLSWLIESWNFKVKTFKDGLQFVNYLNTLEEVQMAAALIDIRMPNMTGLEVQTWMNKRSQFLPIAFMTAHGDINTAITTLKNGAVDFIQKPFDETTLLKVINQLKEKAVVAYEKQQKSSIIALLSRREKEVLGFILKGLLNKQIALSMGLSIKTVEAHRSHIMQKLRATSIADLVQIALAGQEGEELANKI